MVASMCEEVENSEREVPKAIVLSVAAAGVTGLFYPVPLLFVIPEVSALLTEATDHAAGQPINIIFKHATGSAGGGFGLLFLILGILMFSGIGSLTVASRCTYAFARDGAIPGYKLWRRVHSRLDMPIWSLALSTAVISLLGCIYFGSPTAFNSFTGVGTICLSASYAVPIIVNLAQGRVAVKDSPYSLGRWGVVLNGVCAVWIFFAIVIFSMPSALPVQADTMNYASVVFAGFAAIASLWYLVHARHNFTGPPVLRSDSVGATDGVALHDSNTDSPEYETEVK